MKRRNCLLGTLVALALAGGAIVSTSVAGATEVGVNVTTTTGFVAPKVRAAIRESQPEWVRVFLVWSVIEPTQGDYIQPYLANYEKFFASLPAATKVDVDVSGTPSWANGGSPSGATPPVDDTQFAVFMNYLVTAFHDRVDAWEIWNEEDSPNWWSGTAVQFAALTKAAYPAIKSADPKATVILGANDPTFLQQLYNAGAKGSFDAVAVHTDRACGITSPEVYEYDPGTTTVDQSFFLGFTAMHRVMNDAGDGSKPLYMTELGWSTTNAECDIGKWSGQKLGGVSYQLQATYLQQAYHCLAQPAYSYVKAAMWFELYDLGGTSTPEDNYGLLDINYAPKPAFAAFEQESLHGDQLTGPCGNFSPPKIRVLHPSSGERYSGPLKIAIAATSTANGVHEITIQLSKHSRVHFVSKGFPKTFKGAIAWQGAKTLKPGRHTITVTATDKLGNVSKLTIVVVHIKGTEHKTRSR